MPFLTSVSPRNESEKCHVYCIEKARRDLNASDAVFLPIKTTQPGNTDARGSREVRTGMYTTVFGSWQTRANSQVISQQQ